MNKKTVFIKTIRGENEIKDKSGILSGDLRRALFLVDGTSTFDDIYKRSAPSLRNLLPDVLRELIAGGFIRDKAKPFAEMHIAVPKVVTPEWDGDLDFTSLANNPIEETITSEAKNQHAIVDAQTKTQQANEAVLTRSEFEVVAESEKVKAQTEAAATALALAKQHAETEARNKLEADNLAKKEALERVEAETRIKQEIDALRFKAKQDIEKATAELEAASKLKAEAETTRLKTLAEARELAEAQVKKEEEAKIRAEAARVNDEQIAFRVNAEQELAKIKAALEAEKIKVETETKALADARSKHEIERIKAEEEAAKVRAALDEERAKADTEAKALADARSKQETERIRSEEEALKIKAVFENEMANAEAKALAEMRTKQEAERIKAEAELSRIRAALDHEKAKADAEAKALAEVRNKQEIERINAEEEAAKIRATLDAAKANADAETKALAEARSKQEAERIKAEEEATRIRAALDAEKAKADAEAKALAEARSKQEAERIKAEEEAARIRAALNAEKVKADTEAKALAESRNKQETERIKAEKEATRIREAWDAAKADGEAKGLAEIRTKQEAERIKAEEEAARIRAALNAEKAKADAEAKALAEVRTKQEAERIKAEEEAARIRAALNAEKAKVDAEAKALAEVRSKQEAERIKAEEEAARLKAVLNAEKAKVDASVKASAEAGHRNESANAALFKTSQTLPVKSNASSRVRVRHKPLPLGKIVAGTLFLALISASMLPYLMPLDNYIAPIEMKLSKQFDQPVHIGSLHAKIFPWPKLQLEKVTVGAEEELKIANIELIFDPLSIFSTIKNLREVLLNDVTLDGHSLEKDLIWLQKIGLNSNYHYSRVTLQAINLSSSEIALPAFNGIIEFSGSGRIDKVSLRTGDNKFDLSLQAAASRWQLSLNAKDTSLPFFSNVLFDDLAATGEITSSGANFSNVDAQAFGGFLHGNAKLTWQHGWQLQGRLGANGVDLVKLFPNFGVSGELQGDTNFTAFGNGLAHIADSTQMNGTFTVTKGVVTSLDMVETLRQGDRQVGRTHFDTATGSFQVNGKGQHFHQLHLSSGMLNANGSFDSGAKGELSGQLSLELKARRGLSQLNLSGTLSEPVWRLER